MSSIDAELRFPEAPGKKKFSGLVNLVISLAILAAVALILIFDNKPGAPALERTKCEYGEDLRYVSVHDSGIIGHITKQVALTCDNGETYWIDK
ncbi:hypothetical protein KL3_00071 [Klebsiella phage KL3]|nr:hypothetical protein KL3_00071 [Klebsiella phage KL3]